MQLDERDYESLDGTQCSRIVLRVLARYCRTLDEIADDGDGGLWNLAGPACARLGGPARAERILTDAIRRAIAGFDRDDAREGVYLDENGRRYAHWGSERVRGPRGAATATCGRTMTMEKKAEKEGARDAQQQAEEYLAEVVGEDAAGQPITRLERGLRPSDGQARDFAEALVSACGTRIVEPLLSRWAGRPTRLYNARGTVTGRAARLLRAYDRGARRGWANTISEGSRRGVKCPRS